jgi:hypothetical protein
MPRSDLSTDLVHWTKGESLEEAFITFSRIISERTIRGGTGFIRGSYRCVCFTEAPQNHFHEVAGRYKPFGIKLPKSLAFSLGGRPVVYQSYEEFENLTEASRWRHVTYNPSSNPAVDFSWEREWRIPTDSIELNAEHVVLLVPSEEWIDRLVMEHNENETWRIHAERVAYGEWAGLQEPEPFHFRFSVVNV